MSQHFLLSSEARSLSLAKVARLTDEQAFDTFKRIRWSDNSGNPICPHCGSLNAYSFKARPIFKCKDCGKQFSVTSNTIFGSRKLPIRDYLLAIAIFVNGAKGHSALQLSRDLDVSYKCAFVLAHKLREAMTAEQNVTDKLTGDVEVDGAYFGGYVKPANYKEDRKDRRRAEHQTGKRRVVVVTRERNGKTVTSVHKSEAQAVPAVAGRIDKNATVFADEAASWDGLHMHFLTKRINHQEAYSDGEACTNQAESFFSRLRRAEIGIHHHISGKYLSAYAGEMSWREDRRRISNGAQFLSVANAALGHPISRTWKGYWQRSAV